MNGVMETSSLMGDSASQLTHNLALTARASPDADQRKGQGGLLCCGPWGRKESD